MIRPKNLDMNRIEELFNEHFIFNKEDFMLEENEGSHGLFALYEYKQKDKRKLEANLYNILPTYPYK